MSPPPLPSAGRAEQVAAAVRTLFTRYGYRRTSVDDIAREAGIAKATLYLHFAGKEDMFRAMLRQFRETVIARCAAAEQAPGTIEARVADLVYASHGTALEWFGDAAHIRELRAFAAEHPLHHSGDGGGDDRSAFRERVERMLAAAERAGEIDPTRAGTTVGEAAAVLLFAAHGAKSAQRDGAAGYREALTAIVRLVVGPLRRAASARSGPRSASASPPPPGAASAGC